MTRDRKYLIAFLASSIIGSAITTAALPAEVGGCAATTSCVSPDRFAAMLQEKQQDDNLARIAREGREQIARLDAIIREGKEELAREQAAKAAPVRVYKQWRS